MTPRRRKSRRQRRQRYREKKRLDAILERWGEQHMRKALHGLGERPPSLVAQVERDMDELILTDLVKEAAKCSCAAMPPGKRVKAKRKNDT